MLLAASALMALMAASHAAAAPSSSYSGDEAMGQLAASYNVTEADILELRAKGWSWKELGDALAVSKRSGRTLQDVVAERDAGQSWNAIAEKSGFQFHDVSADARHAAREARKADARRKEESRPQEDVPPTNENAPGVPPAMKQQPPPAP